MSFLSQTTDGLDRSPLCSRCQMRLIDNAANCIVCGTSATTNPATIYQNPATIYQFIFIKWMSDHHEIRYNPRSPSEVKLTLKEARLAKRGISNVKRQIMEAKRVIRAKYTEGIRTHTKAKEFWLYAPSLATQRKMLADDLAPLEAEQQTLENLRILVEQSIVQLEGWLMSFES